jgi:hypothetical protein
MPDGWEIRNSLNPLANDASEDPDNDGHDFDNSGNIDSDEAFTNLEEYYAGTDPWDADSDNDRITDGWEVFYGLNPNSIEVYRPDVYEI